jgi:uncharacterized membrane protein
LALGLIANFALRTNAFDLSVFDYALWTTASGEGIAFVPLFGHSLFAQHFMPTLLLLAPLSRFFESPAYLIVLQVLFHSTAAYLLFCFARRHLDRRLALALLIAFLFSRRSNGALTRYFYIESAEPMLIFAALLAWSAGRRSLYWVFAVLALGCKEDVAIYFLAFGTMLAVTRDDRPTGLLTAGLAAAWLIVAVFIAIPYWRSEYGLSAANPFLEGNYGLASGGLSAPLWRLVSLQSFRVVFTVTASTMFLCLLSPRWMAVTLPGLALNLAAFSGSGQAGLSGHYLFPILPWLFVAAVFGAQRIPVTPIRWFALALIVVTLLDAPLPRSLAGTPWNALPDASFVRSQLRTVAPSGTVVAQPNLIPHLARDMRMVGLGYAPDQPDGDYVLLTTVGDQWPLDVESAPRKVSQLQADPRYEQISTGPLFAFRRIR